MLVDTFYPNIDFTDTTLGKVVTLLTDTDTKCKVEEVVPTPHPTATATASPTPNSTAKLKDFYRGRGLLQ